jgi:hypothetical protein
MECYWKFEAIDGFDRSHIQSLLENLLSTPERGGVWVAEMDGRLCGYLTAVYLFSFEYGGMVARNGSARSGAVAAAAGSRQSSRPRVL